LWQSEEEIKDLWQARTDPDSSQAELTESSSPLLVLLEYWMSDANTPLVLHLSKISVANDFNNNSIDKDKTTNGSNTKGNISNKTVLLSRLLP
jgi:hypothetical protein